MTLALIRSIAVLAAVAALMSVNAIAVNAVATTNGNTTTLFERAGDADILAYLFTDKACKQGRTPVYLEKGKEKQCYIVGNLNAHSIIINQAAHFYLESDCKTANSQTLDPKKTCGSFPGGAQINGVKAG